MIEKEIDNNLVEDKSVEQINTEKKGRDATFKQCPSCGAVMRYDPLTDSLKCDYCGTSTKLDASRKARNHEYTPDVEDGFEKWGDVNTYKCPACGAISELANYEMSPICPFCGSKNMIAQEEIKGLKPSGILPFKIDENSAKLKYKDFIKKKWLAPRKLRKNFNVSTIKGIYIPNFNFSSNTASHYKARLGEYYYVTVGSGKNRHQVRRTRYFNVSGNKSRAFEKMQYEVSSFIEQKDLVKMGGFDVENALDYDCSYFAGFSSERYTESLDKTWENASNDMKEIIKKEIIVSYHADVVDTFELDTVFSENRYQYLLVPIWKCGYKYKEKIYNFFINARNGLTTGKAPLSPLKITILSVLGFAVLVMLAIIISKYYV